MPRPPQTPTILSPLCWLLAGSFALLGILLLGAAQPSAQAQDDTPQIRVQQLEGRVEAGAGMDVYRIANLAPGDVIYAYMRATSGNLDPFVALLDGSADLVDLQTRYLDDLQQLYAAEGEFAAGLEQIRGRYFLAWDDDSGQGYAAALEYPVSAGGDYLLIIGGSLSSLGRATRGDYRLTLSINDPQVLVGETQTNRGTPIAVADSSASGAQQRFSTTTGIISDELSVAMLQLVDFDAGDKLQVFVEAASGNLRPRVILRDFGGKPLAAANLQGRSSTATFEHVLVDGGSGYTLNITGAPSADGTPTSGDFRALVGFNTPQVMSGQPTTTTLPALKSPVPVQIGIKIDRISEVDSAGEDFTVIATIRMDWQDPALAFSPDTCSCDVKLYTGKEFDRFLADAKSRWPDFSLFNQQGNRFTQNRAAAVWPDGSARYLERFTTAFQADFDFRNYPFDVQEFPIIAEMILPNDVYELVPLPGFSAISPDHGEDEFVIGDLTSITSTVPTGAGTDTAISRITFTFAGPRHLEYYILQVFVPILLIILISWFTFFLKDYNRRIEAAAANILLFIAFSFSLAGNYPRLGYVTFLDAIMAVTFIVNTLVLLYNVQLKRMETKGEMERVERIDNVLDWLYPLSYVVLIGLVALFFFGPR